MSSSELVETVNFDDDEQRLKFDQFITDYLPEILKEADYDELYGHQLNPIGDYFDKNIRDALVFKFLKARKFDLEATKKQLLETLVWRKEFKPLYAGLNEEHDVKFEDIGMITKYGNEVITWNIYGSTNKDTLFSDLDKFVRYRIGLMERGLQLLDFTSSDKNVLSQVHDYKGVSFLRFDSKTSEASKRIIQLFQAHYPELLSKKFFVNVPSLMSWVYDFVKKWLPTETTKKFKMLHNGSKLVEFLGEEIPTDYGGKGKSLKDQNFKSVQPTNFATFILKEQFTNELD